MELVPQSCHRGEILSLVWRNGWYERVQRGADGHQPSGLHARLGTTRRGGRPGHLRGGLLRSRLPGAEDHRPSAVSTRRRTIPDGVSRLRDRTRRDVRGRRVRLRLVAVQRHPHRHRSGDSTQRSGRLVLGARTSQTREGRSRRSVARRGVGVDSATDRSWIPRYGAGRPLLTVTDVPTLRVRRVGGTSVRDSDAPTPLRPPRREKLSDKNRKSETLAKTAKLAKLKKLSKREKRMRQHCYQSDERSRDAERQSGFSSVSVRPGSHPVRFVVDVALG